MRRTWISTAPGGGGGGGGNHNLLSATHPDTAVASVVRGDLLAGIGASPLWTRVAIAASGQYLRSNGTEPAWSAILDADIPSTIVRTSRQVLSGTGLAGGGDLSVDRTLSVVTDSSVQRIDVRKNSGANVGSRRRLNFIEGSGVTLTIADDGVDNEVDVTIAASAGGNHNLLSATHPDTTAATVARGDLITGQTATPSWARLPLGASGRYLRSDGTDATWATIPNGDLPEPPVMFAGGANDDTVNAGATEYEHPQGAALFSGTLAIREEFVAKAFTAKNFYVRTSNTQPSSGSLVVTVMKSGVATAITLTIAAGAAAGTFSDTVNTAAFAQGDLISYRFVNNATVASAAVNAHGLGGTY